VKPDDHNPDGARPAKSARGVAAAVLLLCSVVAAVVFSLTIPALVLVLIAAVIAPPRLWEGAGPFFGGNVGGPHS
jgi:hypothetical protein